MLPEPNNFIQAVLKGIGNADGAPGLVMRYYASSLSDAEVARLAAYLRRTRTKLPPWTDLENKVAALRGIRRRRTDRNWSYASMTTFDLNGHSVSVHPRGRLLAAALFAARQSTIAKLIGSAAA